MTDRYVTLAARCGFEPPPVKGSRFIARVGPAAGAEEARAFVGEVAAEYDDARHVCWAWRLGPAGADTRSSDDGEPGGSAGRPILAQLEGHGVTDAVAVVVRYFGGVKLGVGGLMRAYGGAAGQALDRAELQEMEVREAVACRHAYGDSARVQGLLASFGLEAESAVYADDVAFVVQVPRARREEFAALFRDATGGRGELAGGPCNPGPADR